MAKKEKDPAKVILSSHTICFPHLKEPSAFKDSDRKEYSIEFLIPYDHPDVDKINDALEHVYNSNKESVFKGAKMSGRNFHNPLRDGEEVLEDYPNRSEVEGHYVLKAKSKSQPAVFDENGDEIYDIDDIYSGCICRGVIVFRPFNHDSGKKGISCFLNSVKFMEEGERIGGFSASHDDYEDEDDAAPRRKSSKPAARRSRDDEEDEAPRSRRRSTRDDEEEDEAPVRRRTSSRDEEEDEPPRRRRQSRRDEDDLAD